jgi:putative endonuclease
MAQRFYYVYIMASISRVLYTGMTNQIVKRAWEHRHGVVDGFTKKYRVHRLVYFEQYRDVREAIQREKDIKSWNRAKKVKLIESVNPTWEDLSQVWQEAARREGEEAQRKRALLKVPAQFRPPTP